MKKEMMTEKMKDHPEENIMMKREIDTIIINIQDMMIEEEVQEEIKRTKMIIMIKIITNQGHTEMINIETIILEKENTLKIHILPSVKMITRKRISLTGINLKIKLEMKKINHKIQKRK